MVSVACRMIFIYVLITRAILSIECDHLQQKNFEHKALIKSSEIFHLLTKTNAFPQGKNKYFINYKAIFSICFIYLDPCF